MHDIRATLLFLFGLAYVGLIGYLAWFSPKGYAKYVVIMKKWHKATSIIYIEEYMDFCLSPTGFGLWIARIMVITGLLICLRGVIFGIWGI